MTEAAKKARREYKRKWQQENADKVKGYQSKYWERKAKEAAAAAKRGNDPQPQEG